MDLKKIPFTNGIDSEVKGYIDLTDIINDSIIQADKEIKELKGNGNW